MRRCAALLLFAAATAVTAGEPLRFDVIEGRIENAFFREGPVAAHLVLTSGESPRLVAAFPAGNSGVAAWFESVTPLTWAAPQRVAAVTRDVDAGTLRGVTAELEARGGPLAVRHAILSSVRVIRDYGYTGTTPSSVLTRPVVDGNAVTWRRPRLDGGAGYFLSIEALHGSVVDDGGTIRLLPDDGVLRLRVTALSGDEPLTPLTNSRLLTSGARDDVQLRHALDFLAYEGKLLAGSWRFNTYFGRDTLMSVQLLLPVLQPAAAEAGIGSVLERLNTRGEVAHEEDIGEFAILRHLEVGDPAGIVPYFDYKMIDDDFMLAIVAANALLGTQRAARAGAFLARESARGESYGTLLARNFAFVVAETRGFAREPAWYNLVALRPGEYAGNWRDSSDGLGGGRIPYDVNAVLAPAALVAIDRFLDSGLLDKHVDAAMRSTLGRAGDQADTWLREAPALFEVTLAAHEAGAGVRRLAAELDIPAAPALQALGHRPLTFHAVALDANGQPLPVMHSDEGYALLFLEPPADTLATTVATLMRPFPAGLMTDVGPVVANPAYADAELAKRFDRGRYHGATIWSWQQAMLAAGIDRQLTRDDLPSSAREVLESARDKLQSAIAAAHDIRGSELWSWTWDDGRFRAVPFGQRAGDETESNAAQLWSTVWLAAPGDD